MQLPLPVTLPDDETFDSFVPSGNEEVVQVLATLAEAMPDWRQAKGANAFRQLKLPLITLIGARGRGKSHLLFSLCHRLESARIAHLYLNLEDAGMWSTHVLDGLDTLPLVCLDNLHAIAGNAEWEETLFAFLVRVQEQGNTLVVCTSAIGAAHPDFILPDLRSRLTWGMTYQLHSLNDDARKDVLRIRAEQRGLRLSEQALHFLLMHSQRDMPGLMQLLSRLDTRSLQEQKKLSVAMVKRELNLA